MDGEQTEPLQFIPREIAQILHARDYAKNHQAAGAPGHGQFMLIAKLSLMLEEVRSKQTEGVQKVAWDDKAHCWRDIVTGVAVRDA